MKTFLYLIIVILVMGCGLAERNPISGEENSQSPNSQGNSGEWRLLSVSAVPSIITREQTSTISVHIDKSYGLSFEWQTSQGQLSGSGAQVELTPDDCCTGIYRVSCIISDSFGRSELATAEVFVQ